MGRRRFTKTLAGIGVSAGTISALSQNTLADITENPHEEVPYVSHYLRKEVESNRNNPPEREAVFKTIPRDKWVRVEAAYSAAERLQTLLDRTSGAGMVQPAVTTGTGGRKELELVRTTIIRSKPDGSKERIEPEIDARTLETEAPGRITATVGESLSIPTETVEMPVRVTEEEKHESAYYDGRYRPVPGGCKFQVKGNAGSATTCSLATPAYSNKRGEYMLLTAGHCFANTGGSDDAMQPSDTWDDKHQIGYADEIDYTNTDGNITSDSATVFVKNADTTMKMASDSGGYNEDINGITTWAHIRNDMEGNSSYSVTRQGQTSGRRTGYIDKTYPSYYEFRNTANCKGGDSGGTHFEDFGGSVTIVGVQSWGQDKYADDPASYYYSGGFAVDHLEDKYDLVVV